ncbi:hypothetical protein V6N13_075922 [Hibiscus sabdariffa]|uniref:DUF4378 domain-containing protein n=1 Tax=Hibiscus sabdariffa TaxID=183260 RepID=A0ABR2UD03_9ROSI
MAARSRASKSGRQLGELLQEQQEPFILKAYLSERGCVKKKLISGANFINFSCCHGNSGKFFNKSGSQNESRKGSPRFPKVLQVILGNKFFKIKGLRTKNSDDEDGKLSVTEMDINNDETAEADRFSSASSATLYDSCSDTDIDEPPMFADTCVSDWKLHDDRENNADADTKFEWSCMEENKQHSPRSVLDEVSTSTSSPPDNPIRVSRKRLFWPKLIKVDSTLSTWLLNVLVQTRPVKSSSERLKQLQVPDWSNSSRSSKSKRVLLQKMQLLSDCCIREMIEINHDKKGKGKGIKGSAEVIRKVRCENLKELGKRCGDKSNIKQLLELDILNSTEEWRNDFESWDIGKEIGDAIVEEITIEVVKSFLYS